MRETDLSNFVQRPQIVKDLVDRDVLVRDQSGLLSIRVGLFSEWLRGNKYYFDKVSEMLDGPPTV